MIHRLAIAAAALAMGLAACQTTGTTLKEAASVAPLSLAFTDPAWTGKAVPAKQWCKRFGGNGATPALRVADLPAGTSAVIIAFNDESYPAMDNGGHGVLRLAVPAGATSVDVPAVPGESEGLPAGVTTERAHSGQAWSGTGGAYLPPCSGGRGNVYTATVRAVSGDAKQGLVLGRGKITLGQY